MVEANAAGLLVHEDVSTVGPVGGYAARTCPMKVALDAAPPEGVVLVEPTPAVLERRQAGRDFEDQVLDLLVAAHPGAVDLRGAEGHELAVAQTMAALEAGAPLVLAARLPDDEAARRSGRPDVLLRGRRREDGAWGYLPVDVKWHKTIASSSKGTCPGYVSTLDEITRYPGDLIESTDQWARWDDKHKDDALQLAHYWRMLETLGLVDDRGGAWGGVIGSEALCTWYRLDDEGQPRTSWRTVTGRWSTLEAYDHEFGFRLDILARLQDGQDPKVVPALISRWCDGCAWWEYCEAQMVEADEVTLLPGVDWNRRMRLHTGGLTTREQIAALDLEAAALADLDAPGRIIATSREVDPDTPAAELTGRKNDRGRLADLGLQTARDVLALDRATLDVIAQVGNFRGLTDLILQARADLTGEVLLRPGVDELAVPRADVEIDLDMESYGGEVYLWGMRIHDPGGHAGEPGTHYLIREMADLSADFDPAALFRRAWERIADIRRRVEAGGAMLAIYSWSPIETTMFRRYAEHVPSPADVEALISDTDIWIDLEKVVKGQLVLPLRGKTGLKDVAAGLAGFRGWDEVKDRFEVGALDGDESMTLFAAAVGEGERGDPDPEAAEVLLAYNRADVDATWTVREWLSILDVVERGLGGLAEV